MKKSEDKSEQGKIAQRIDTFFEEDLKRELCSLRSEFRAPVKQWFIKTRDEIQRIRKEDEEHYKQTIDIISSNMPALERTIDGLRDSGWHLQYRKAIIKACESLPERVEEIQVEDRYQPLEGDSLKVKGGKFVKRFGRLFTKTGFRRKVELRELVTRLMLQEISWIEKLAAREYDEYAMLIDMLLEKNSAESEQSEEDNNDEKETATVTDFEIDIFREAEEHLQVSVQHLKQFEENNEEQIEQYLNEIKGDVSEKIAKAGTFEESKKKGAGQSDAFGKKKAERLLKQQEKWLNFLQSQISDLHIQTEIARYGAVASSVKEELLKQSHEFFRDTFYLPIEEGVKVTGEAIDKLRELEESSDKQVKKKLEEIRDDLTASLQEKLIGPMQDRTRLMRPIYQMQNLISDLQVESRRFSDEAHLAEKRESAYPLPVLKMDKIRWQSLAARFLKEEALKKLDPALQEFDLFLKEMVTEVEEAVQVSDVNLFAAMESKETDSEEDEPLKIALEGLQRAVNTLEKTIKQVREKQNGYQEIVERRLPTALNSLAQTMLKRDFDRFEMQDKALMMKQQAVNWKQKMSSKWAGASERVEIGWRFFTKKFRGVLQFVGPYLGFKEEDLISTKEKRNLAEYLAKPGKENELPFIYKRLFDRDFDIDERFYIKPKKTLDLIKNSYEQWQSGMSANVAVVGEKGSGKSTMIRFAEKEIFGDAKPHKVVFDDTITNEPELLKKLCDALGFKQTDNREEFLEKVERKKLPSILVVENLQNIFIRNIHGYEALESFWVIMSATMEKLFWVVSSSRYSWNFFEKMSSADQYFSHVVWADNLDEGEVREAVLARHRSTGYELYFEPSEAMKNSRAYKKLLGDEKQSQELIRDMYFSKLAKISEGNTSIAMIFWLQSIKEFDNRRFVFRPLEVTDVDKLEIPSKEVLFTLAALVVHDTLTKNQMAKALHEEEAQSHLMLARLKTKGIVYRNSSGYNLNHLVYRQVVRLLKRRNIIH